MNYKNAFLVLFGILLGWISCPYLNAGDEGDFRTYKQALHIMIDMMQDIKTYSKQTADNTNAIKIKLGAK